MGLKSPLEQAAPWGQVDHRGFQAGREERTELRGYGHVGSVKQPLLQRLLDLKTLVSRQGGGWPPTQASRPHTVKRRRRELQIQAAPAVAPSWTAFSTASCVPNSESDWGWCDFT